MKFKIKHIGCCTGEHSIDIIEGDNIKHALTRFMRDCFSDGSSCTIQTIIDGQLMEYDIEASHVWKYNIDEKIVI